MFRNKMSIFIYIVVSLAIIGLMVQLMTNFTGFLMSILLMIIIAFVVFLILNHFVANRAGGGSGASYGSSPEMRKYREAVKRSQEKYGKQKVTVRRQSKQAKGKNERRRRFRRRPSHLRVIDGKKSKDEDKNNRASF